MESILFKPSLRTDTIEDELAHLGRQIAVGMALREAPQILSYFTALAEANVQNTFDVNIIKALEPAVLKDNMTAFAAEVGVAKHMYDLATGVEVRSARYNEIQQSRNSTQQ